MSTMQLLPRAGREQLQPKRVDARPSRLETEPRPHNADEEMMYAWSIGVVTGKRDAAAERHLDECPPEVYIG